MQEVEIASLDPSRFDDILDPTHASRFSEVLGEAADRLEGHTFWHVNSTAAGGGVAEMLQSVLCYLSGAGITTRWLVLEGDDDFFVVTKRIHHFLHGSEGDGGELGPAEHAILTATLDRQLDELFTHVQAGDVVVLHDPQTLAFAPALKERGVGVIWSCHVGTDEPNEFSKKAWEFLAPFAQDAHKVVFSRGTYVWDGLDGDAVEIIPPCIDAFSPKNQRLDTATVEAILANAGVIQLPADTEPRFERQDGTPSSVRHRAEMIEEQPIEAANRVVTQISRWDPLKDHEGVMKGFCRHVPADLDAHLVLAGPSPASVTDDPEGGQTLEDLRAVWRALDDEDRARVHIACLPMDDLEENAAIVNALQRWSDVIVQKSLAEGFGLTVAEAMWKETPTVAAAVGGIQDQIEDGVSGVLIADAEDLPAFGQALTDVLTNAQYADELGHAAHTSVRDHYLAPHYLIRFLELALKTA